MIGWICEKNFLEWMLLHLISSSLSINDFVFDDLKVIHQIYEEKNQNRLEGLDYFSKNKVNSFIAPPVP